MLQASEYAYNYIRERILSGEYKPSQHLIEEQLSKEMQVSRNSREKALLQIEKENLVKVEENKGATVASLTLTEILQYYEIRLALSGS